MGGALGVWPIIRRQKMTKIQNNHAEICRPLYGTPEKQGINLQVRYLCNQMCFKKHLQLSSVDKTQFRKNDTFHTL